ncbi:MAG: ABC transporter permease [Saccharofermentanales bacterium]|nr:ABC transporter permease [Clostridiaceae bacterium]
MEGAKKFVQKYYLFLVLLLVVIFFSIMSEPFRTTKNFINILVQNSYLVIASIGISLVMISGGADLSVSYQIGLVSVFTGIITIDMGLSPVLGVIVGLALGVVLGFINGFFTVALDVHPMVTTLATMTIFQGAAHIISESKTYFDFPVSFKAIGQRYVGGIPVAVIITLGMVIIAYVMLNHTYFGRYLYAIGGNQEAARLAGINIRLIRIAGFIVASLFIAVSAIVLTARSGTAKVDLASDAVFSCFTACVLGGISFRGGGGNILGVVVGTLIIGVLGNGMQMIGLSMYSQYIVKGAILIGAIAFDNYQKKHRVKKLDVPQTA